MKKVKSFFITLCIVAVLLLLGYGYYRYTNYYYGKQFYAECSIKTEQDSYNFSSGDTLAIPVTVKNPSRISLTQSNNYFLSYHLLDASGKELEADGERTPLNVDPFRSETLSMDFEVPESGSYQLEIDVVRDGYYWHGDLGGKTTTISVTVN